MATQSEQRRTLASNIFRAMKRLQALDGDSYRMTFLIRVEQDLSDYIKELDRQTARRN
jgi:hypothetical protein